MACVEKIALEILNSCETIPVGGFEKKAWALNRADITATIDGTVNNLITAIAMASTTRAWPITAVKKENNGGFDLIVADTMPDTFQHYFSIMPYEKGGANIVNIDSMSDLIIVAELKGEKEEGSFVLYGLESGLFKSAASHRQNENNGLPTYEFQTLEGQGERFSRYVFWATDYATSLAALVTLETPAA